jgi:F-type H+-transporting ATPase subunit c
MKKILIVLGAALFSVGAFAQDGSTFGPEMKYFAYFFGMAIASYGGTRAQSAAASVALEGIARNPGAADKLQTPMILALALMESLVIFMLISVFLANQIV